MKFVSKSSNLMVVLKPGIPGNHLTGQAPVTGLYVKFSNGIVDVKEETLIEKMKLHPGFGVDYIALEEEAASDPYAHYRKEVEPDHVITEIKYGHVEKSITPKKEYKMPPELTAMIKDEAKKIALAMLQEMSKEQKATKEAEVKVDTEKLITPVKQEKKSNKKSDSEIPAEA